jgi:hypothetical protein
MPAAGPTHQPQVPRHGEAPRIRALFLPADPHRLARIVLVELSSTAISDAIGGGLLHEINCTDTTTPTHVVYQDADRDAKELPRNDRAWRLAARLNWPHVHHRISLRGDALITGLDTLGQDTDVLNEVATAAFFLRVLPDRRGPHTRYRQ